MEDLDIRCGDASKEEWREYEWRDPKVGTVVYRIERPVKVYFGKGHSFHRVFDGRIVHLVPAPGTMGCIVRWEPGDKKNPVQF